MKFVIELNNFVCIAAEHQAMCWGWEREPKRHSQQLVHQSPSWAGGGRAAP